MQKVELLGMPHPVSGAMVDHFPMCTPCQMLPSVEFPGCNKVEVLKCPHPVSFRYKLGARCKWT